MLQLLCPHGPLSCTIPSLWNHFKIQVYSEAKSDEAELSMLAGDPSPLIQVRPADHQDGFFRTNISLGRPSLPGGWDIGNNATPIEGDHCLPYWAASFRGDQLVHMDCLKIRPTWMWDHRQVYHCHLHHQQTLVFSTSGLKLTDWFPASQEITYTSCNPNAQLHSLFILALEEGDWSASHPGCFTPKEMTSRNALHMRLGDSQNQFEYFGEEENFLSLPGIGTVHPTHSLVTIQR